MELCSKLTHEIPEPLITRRDMCVPPSPTAFPSFRSASTMPHHTRAVPIGERDLGLETIVTMCLCGPAAETLFRGPIEDGSDSGDLQMAREYLARAIANPLQAAIEFARCRAAAERTFGATQAQQRIRLLADALLRCGTLSGEEIHRI